MVDVAVGQPDATLDVKRREQLPVDDRVAEVRRVGRDRVDEALAGGLPDLIPGTGRRMHRRVHPEDREDVLPGRGNSVVIDGRDLDRHDRGL